MVARKREKIHKNLRWEESIYVEEIHAQQKQSLDTGEETKLVVKIKTDRKKKKKNPKYYRLKRLIQRTFTCTRKGDGYKRKTPLLARLFLIYTSNTESAQQNAFQF